MVSILWNMDGNAVMPDQKVQQLEVRAGGGAREGELLAGGEELPRPAERLLQLNKRDGIDLGSFAVRQEEGDGRHQQAVVVLVEGARVEGGDQVDGAACLLDAPLGINGDGAGGGDRREWILWVGGEVAGQLHQLDVAVVVAQDQHHARLQQKPPALASGEVGEVRPAPQEALLQGQLVPSECGSKRASFVAECSRMVLGSIDGGDEELVKGNTGDKVDTVVGAGEMVEVRQAG